MGKGRTLAVTRSLLGLVVVVNVSAGCFIGVTSCPKKSKSECRVLRRLRLLLSELLSPARPRARRLCGVAIASAADVGLVWITACRHLGNSSSASSNMRRSVQGKEAEYIATSVSSSSYERRYSTLTTAKQLKES